MLRNVARTCAVTGSIQTDYENIAGLADLGASFNGIGLDNIKFVTTPWGGTDKVSGGVDLAKEPDRTYTTVPLVETP